MLPNEQHTRQFDFCQNVEMAKSSQNDPVSLEADFSKKMGNC